MSEIKPSYIPVDNKTPNKTWGDHLKSSLLIGLILSVVWMIIVIAAGAYDPRGAEDLSGLLGNAFGIFVILSSFALIVKSTWYYFIKSNKQRVSESGENTEAEEAVPPHSPQPSSIGTILIFIITGVAIGFCIWFLMAKIFDPLGFPRHLIVSGDSDFGLFLGMMITVSGLLLLRFKKARSTLFGIHYPQISISILISINAIMIAILGIDQGISLFKIIVPAGALIPLVLAWRKP